MIRPKKALGQNFLRDKGIAQALVKAGEITRADLVLEVGAGTGFVTRVLAPQAGKVLAVEFDRDIMTTLENNTRELGNVTVIAGDILSIDIGTYFVKSKEFKKFKIIGSIPRLHPLPNHLPPNSQNHGSTLVVDSRSTNPERGCRKDMRSTTASHLPLKHHECFRQNGYSKKCTQNSIFTSSPITSAFAKTAIVKNVPKTAFSPRPQVDGAIIKIVRDSNILKHQNIKVAPFANFLHRGFSHPRKMLRNTFSESKLKEVKINPQARAQELDLKEWFKLFQRLNV